MFGLQPAVWHHWATAYITVNLTANIIVLPRNITTSTISQNISLCTTGVHTFSMDRVIVGLQTIAWERSVECDIESSPPGMSPDSQRINLPASLAGLGGGHEMITMHKTRCRYCSPGISDLWFASVPNCHSFVLTEELDTHFVVRLWSSTLQLWSWPCCSKKRLPAYFRRDDNKQWLTVHRSKSDHSCLKSS